MSTRRRPIPVAKILIASGLLFGASLISLWWIFVRAPDPQSVCRHKVELAHKALGPDSTSGSEFVQRLQASCEDNERRRIKLRGKIKYAERARCIVAAEDLESAERC